MIPVELVGPLSRRTAAAATVASVVLALAAPLSLYVQTHRAMVSRSDLYAQRMAELVDEVAMDLPDLWAYNVPKLARHLQVATADPQIQHVAVIDGQGRRIDVPMGVLGSGTGVHWASAPVHRGETVIAWVWVAVDSSGATHRLMIVAALSLLLGALLSTVLYVLPVRVVGRAEARIGELVSRLELARSDLARLNADLEQRVVDRSRQLAEAVEAIKRSEGRIRSLAGKAAEATEQERLRVARELHDGAGQVLTAIRLSIQVVAATTEAGSATADRVAETSKLVDDAIDEIRRIAMALRPAALDRLDVTEALAELCGSIGAKADFEVTFEHQNIPPRLPAAVERSCYRFVQEGLTNVVRYSGAKKVTVIMGYDDDMLTAKVEDDGQGFDPAARTGGLGLQGMYDRTALLGGTFEVESAVGEGTVLIATFPVGKAESIEAEG